MHSTIKDVAAHSGVSIATVLRALNAPQLLNAETLARLQAANREFLAPWDPVRDSSFFTATYSHSSNNERLDGPSPVWL